MDDAISSAWRQPNTFMDIIRPAVPKSPRNAPDRSSTLMRTAVKVPQPTITTPITTPTSIDDKAQSSFSPARPDLASSASAISRSPLISRYPEVANQLGATAVKDPGRSVDQTQTSIVSQAQPIPQPISNQINDAQDATMTATTINPVAVQSNLPAVNIFSSNLATSMPDLAKKTAKTKVKSEKKSLIKKASGWSVVAIIAIGIVAGGLFINSNLNKVEFYVAASRAGFKATLPNARPSGYDLSSVSAGSGVIEAIFKSNSNNQNYSIEETKSSVSNNQLLNNFVLSKSGSNYQTINTNGRSIYVYNGHNATWISQGIWYVIQDNNSLSNNQIVKIVNSM